MSCNSNMFGCGNNWWWIILLIIIVWCCNGNSCGENCGC